MKFKTAVFLFFVFYKSVAQDSLATKPVDVTNPILFTEFYGGVAGGSSGGFFGGLNLNYQTKNNLYTARYTGVTNPRLTAVLFIIPAFITDETITEYAFLFGKRHIYDNHSFSYSGGVSIVNRNYLIDNSNNLKLYSDQNSFGFPFEVNIKWFKRAKKPYRIYYGLIPIGKRKVGFGQSVGFKLVGNISKTYFIGVGLNMGVGWHKIY